MELSLFGLLSWYLIFLFSLVAHEAAHAFAALKLGDSTAHQGGQVTLDPYPHIKREVMGTVVIPLLAYIRTGWMIGWASAPFNTEWANKHPRRHALMALAGPASNLCIVLSALIFMKIGIYSGALTTPVYPDAEHLVVSESANWLYVAARFLSIAFYLNIILFLFNLCPLPPFDGWFVIKGIFTDNLMGMHKDISSNTVLRWGGIIVAWALFSNIIRPIIHISERLINI